MSKALAVRYRPKTFDDIVEQNITTMILKKQLENKNFKNCYGFFGASGCGKTTIARCFANAINNNIGEPIEIDGATAGNVESIRAIVESANTRALNGEYKIFIIDECQMLGGGRKENSPAWTALLKCIEECPIYTIFIMCSTDPDKIPDAIINRLQRFNFLPISQAGIKNRLISICKQEGFSNYEQTCDLVSKISQGCLRDAITYLEKCADYSTDLSIKNTKAILGTFSYEIMFKLTLAIKNKDEKTCISIIDELTAAGQSIKQFINLYLEFCLDLTKYLLFKDINLTNIPSYLATKDNNVVEFTLTGQNTLEFLNNLTDSLLELKMLIKYDTNIKSTAEAYLIKLIRGK